MPSTTAKSPPSLGLGPLLIVGILLIYASLYPFHFVFPPPEGAWGSLLTLSSEDLRFGNTLGNLLLFVPLGLLVGGRFPPRRRGILVALGVGLLLGVALQAAQVFLPERMPSLWDAGWNAVGTLGGALIPGTPLRRLQAWVPPHAGFAAGLIILWLAAETFPFVPTLDWPTLKEALEPLLWEPEIRPLDIGAHLMGWLAFTYLWRYPLRWSHPRWGPTLVFGGVLLAQVLIINRAPEASQVLGGLIGLLLGQLPGDRDSRTSGILGLLVLWLVGSGLSPWSFQGSPEPFHWLPFAGLLESGFLYGTWMGLQKLFWYGLLLELLGAAGWRWQRAAVSGVVLVGAIEWGQRWVAGAHVAEITDPLFLAALAIIRAWSSGELFPSQGLPEQMRHQQANRHPEGMGANIE